MKYILSSGIAVSLICSAFLSYGLGMGPEATAAVGPPQVLSNPMGVDFGPYLQRVLRDVRSNWYNHIPESARAPFMKRGTVTIEFAILKNGEVAGMKLVANSGDVPLDRGAWTGITASSPFPPLPSEFSGPSLGLRMTFFYNPDKGDLAQMETLSFGGENRTYQVFAPSRLAAPAPVLLLLNGSGHDSSSFIYLWQRLAQKEGVILVAPDSSVPAEWDSRKDSPDFLHAVLEKVESKYVVDRRRVYVFGHSAGAVYALYLSIMESEYFAATAIYTGSLLESNFKLIDSAERKIPISIWTRTEDRSFPLSQVIATRDAFNTRGFAVELHEIPGHDQNYDVVAGEVNGAAWQFLKANKLGKDPDFHALAQLPHPLSTIDSRSQSHTGLELTPQSFDRSVWASAKPYLDNPLPQLTVDIPELHGLEPAPDQQPLAEVLKKTGDKSLDLLKRMPNVISHEKVVTKVEPRGPTWRQQFEYLVLRHETNGEVTLDEYRTDKANTGTAPLAKGVANAWVLFHPGNLVESRFRFLGHQRMDGHATLVLAFAQIPDKVKFPGQVDFGGTSIPVLFQGIAWIDESDFRIVRLRKDLLAPRPDIYLRTLTSEVRFSEVRLPETADPLWLPQEATTTWNFKGQVVQQLHRYSGFHLYRSKTKIVL